jgi:hypothetical protein
MARRQKRHHRSKRAKTINKAGLGQESLDEPRQGHWLDYWRVVGDVEELIDKAKEMAQRTLFGTGFARILKAF